MEGKSLVNNLQILAITIDHKICIIHRCVLSIDTLENCLLEIAIVKYIIRKTYIIKFKQA